MMVVYEIHTFRDGAWKIDSIFDDRDLAVLEAQRVEKSLRFTGVRVIEETYDEATDRAVTRTIYRSSKADRQRALAVQRPNELPTLAADGRTSGGTTTVAKHPASLSRVILVATLTAGAILFCSLGAIYALNALTH